MEVDMRKFIFIFILIFILFGCPLVEPEEEQVPQATPTTLRITNQSSYDMLSVTYSTVEFGDLAVGKDITKNITADSLPIYFNLKIFDTDVHCKTNELITCGEGVSTAQAITNNTTVTSVDSNQSGTLREVYEALIAAYSKPLLELSRGDTVIANNEPLPFDFGTVEVGTNKTVVFTIKSTGNVPLELTGDPLIVSSNTVFTIPTQPNNKTINSGSSLSFLVQYTPTTEKEDTGTITILNNSESMVFTLNIKGNGYQKKPQTVVTYNDTVIPQNGTINAGEVLVTLSKTITVTVKNSGDAPLTIDTENITITGADASAFTRITSPSVNIPIGEQTSFDIACAPVKQGENSATLSIKTNDPVNDPTLVQLRVTGVQGSGILELSREDGTVITNNDINPVDFEVVEIGYNKSFMFTIKNTGNIALILTGNPAVDSSNTLFQVSAQPQSNTIKPGGSVSFYIRYTPTGEGGDTGDITIMNNSSAGTIGFKVKGTGYQKKARADIYYNDTAVPQNGTIDAGEVLVTLSKTITVTVKNSGDAPLTIDTENITISGTEASSFARISSPSMNIPIGNQASFDIECTPIKPGENNAALSIKTNDPINDPVLVQLKVTGIQGSGILELMQGETEIAHNNLTPVDFGVVDVSGSHKSITFTIKNTGNIALELTGSPLTVESTSSVFTIPNQPSIKILNPGAQVPFIVRYMPTTEKEDSGTITLMNSGSTANFSFAVKGTGYQKKPQITVTKRTSAVDPYSEYDFGAVADDESKDVTFTIGNSGDAALVFEVVDGNRINLVENTSGFFTVVSQPVSNILAPGSTASFTVRYKPTEAGTNLTATIGIKTNSRENDDFRFSVHGSSFQKQPQITITQGDSTINPSGEYDFGTIVQNSVQEIAFTITNSGEANLTFVNNTEGNRIYLEDDTANIFAVTLQPMASTVVTPGATSEFKIRFNPAEAGTYLATVVVSTNSHESPLLYFRIKGVSRGYIIGDTGPAGGIVFYDKGVFTDGWRYLEAAPFATEFFAQWGAYLYNVAGTQEAVGTGAANTAIIVSYLKAIGQTGQAAQLCDTLVFGGYTDWFMPSKNELNLMYTNLKVKGWGNFSNEWYWSSTQTTTDFAWDQSFGNGIQYYYLKYGPNYVRAIRAF